MLVVIVAVAILAALAVDLSYETQVRLKIAGNARDQLRAEALAQSAVNLSRVVLAFQYQIDQTMAAAAPPQAQSGTSTGANPTSVLPRPQLWSLIPVSSVLARSLFGDAGATAPPHKAAEGAPQAAAAPDTLFGDFQGGFQARIEDEGTKINAQLDGLPTTSKQLAPSVEAFLRLICDPRWDPLFDRVAIDGERYSRVDLLVHLRDWVNPDSGASTLNVSVPGGNCSFVLGTPPFEKSFGDKNTAYEKGPDRYKTKNGRMDSLAELYQVAGVSDAFMAAFGDQLTVYLPAEAAINVNATSLLDQLRNVALVIDPDSVGMLADPVFQKNLHKALSDATLGGFVAITPAQFLQILQGLSVPLRSNASKTQFTDRSLAFRIHALGVAGDVTQQIDAVVTYDPNAVPAAERASLTASVAAGQLNLGQLIHWREE